MSAPAEAGTLAVLGGDARPGTADADQDASHPQWRQPHSHPQMEPQERQHYQRASTFTALDAYQRLSEMGHVLDTRARHDRATVEARARAMTAAALLRECEQTERTIAAEVQTVLSRGVALANITTGRKGGGGCAGAGARFGAVEANGEGQGEGGLVQGAARSTTSPAGDTVPDPAASDEAWPSQLRGAAMHLRGSVREILEASAALHSRQLQGAAAGVEGGAVDVLIRRGNAAVQRAVSAMASGCQRSLAAEAEIAAARSQLGNVVRDNKQLAAQVESLQGQLSLSRRETGGERAAAGAAALGGEAWQTRARELESALARATRKILTLQQKLGLEESPGKGGGGGGGGGGGRNRGGTHGGVIGVKGTCSCKGPLRYVSAESPDAIVEERVSGGEGRGARGGTSLPSCPTATAMIAATVASTSAPDPPAAPPLIHPALEGLIIGGFSDAAAARCAGARVVPVLELDDAAPLDATERQAVLALFVAKAATIAHLMVGAPRTLTPECILSQ